MLDGTRDRALRSPSARFAARVARSAPRIRPFHRVLGCLRRRRTGRERTRGGATSARGNGYSPALFAPPSSRSLDAGGGTTAINLIAIINWGDYNLSPARVGSHGDYQSRARSDIALTILYIERRNGATADLARTSSDGRRVTV